MVKYIDASWLDPDKFSQTIYFRDNEIEKLSRYVFNAPLENRKAENVLVYGDPGTGKTLVINKLIRALEEKTHKQYCYYLNLGCKSFYMALRDLYRNLFNEEAVKGLHTYELVEAVINKLYEVKGKKHNIILVFDEFDKYLNSRQGTASILYSFLRPGKEDMYLSLILIGNDIFMRDKFNPGIQSSFGHSWLKFYSYTSEQLFSILKERVNLALTPNVISDEQIMKIASYVAEEEKRGDARFAIEVLRQAVLLAGEKVTDENIEEAKKEIEMKSFIEEIDKLDLHSLIILYFTINLYVKGRSLFPLISHLYRQAIISKKEKILLSDKQMLRRLGLLESVGFLHSSKRYDLQGQPLFFSPKINHELIMEHLKLNMNKRFPLLQEDLDTLLENNLNKWLT